MDIIEDRPLRNRIISFNLKSFVFWILFSLVYIFLNQILIIASLDKFRLGFLALIFGMSLVIINYRIIRNDVLILIIFMLSITILISSLINKTSLLQTLAFIRIPLIFYLIFNIVHQYINSEKRALKVYTILLTVAFVQLPILILQRNIFPILPSRITMGLSATDFGMGTFSGDTAMAFALIGMVILLLFGPGIIQLSKYRLLLAGWLSLTVFVSNSQIQHIAILLVWTAYLLSNLRLKTIIIFILLFVLVLSLLVFLSQTDLMTYPMLENTIIKFSAVSQIFSKDVDYDVFLSGGYARGAAISYYLNQPIKWFGDGPGSVYDTLTGQRTVGSFGHAFTFYAEVGLIGWFLSILMFFVVAFPINVSYSSAKMRVSWVGALMFFAVMLVSIVKYPMGDVTLVFTYCVILICYKVMSRTSTGVSFSSSTLSEIRSNPYTTSEV